MPHLTRPIYLHTEHRHQQTRTAPRNRLKHAFITFGKLRPVQRKLPHLSTLDPRLLMNLCHHRCKFSHRRLHPTPTVAFSNSISRTLPTQNGVR